MGSWGLAALPGGEAARHARLTTAGGSPIISWGRTHTAGTSYIESVPRVAGGRAGTTRSGFLGDIGFHTARSESDTERQRSVLGLRGVSVRFLGLELGGSLEHGAPSRDARLRRQPHLPRFAGIDTTPTLADVTFVASTARRHGHRKRRRSTAPPGRSRPEHDARSLNRLRLLSLGAVASPCSPWRRRRKQGGRRISRIRTANLGTDGWCSRPSPPLSKDAALQHRPAYEARTWSW